MKGNIGVFTLYDAVLFFVFVMIASTVLSVYVMYPSQSEYQQAVLYNQCMETRRAVMASTVPQTTYHDGGKNYTREDVSVRNLLLEQIHLERNGIPRENITYPEDIIALVNGHVDGDWAFSISSPGVDDIVIHRNGISDGMDDIQDLFRGNTVSSGFIEYGLDNEEVNIVFYLFT